MQGMVVRSLAWLGWNLCILSLFSLKTIASMLDHGNPPVNKQVKGLLKGLRYISQIFEGEKEQEMMIGLPTDVKHVAHIGWDGPTTLSSPSWMNEFHSAPLSATSDPTGKQSGSPKSASQEIPLGGVPPSLSEDEETSTKPRRTRRHPSSESPGGSPTRESRDSSSRGSRHSRKHPSTGSAPRSDSPTREGSESSSSRHGRRHHKSADSAAVGSESESPARDLPSIPKQSRKKEKEGRKEGKKDKDEKKEERKEGKKERKSKASDGGSTRSKSKNPTSSSSGLSGSEERTARPVTREEAPCL